MKQSMRTSSARRWVWTIPILFGIRKTNVSRSATETQEQAAAAGASKRCGDTGLRGGMEENGVCIEESASKFEGSCAKQGKLLACPEPSSQGSSLSSSEEEEPDSGEDTSRDCERRSQVDEEIEQDLRRAQAFAGYRDDDSKCTGRPYTRRWTKEVFACLGRAHVLP